MKVAWHEVPGTAHGKNPSRRDGVISSTPGDHRLKGRPVSSVRGACNGNQTRSCRPYGTVSIPQIFQALRARLPSFSPFETMPNDRRPPPPTRANAKRQTQTPNAERQTQRPTQLTDEIPPRSRPERRANALSPACCRPLRLPTENQSCRSHSRPTARHGSGSNRKTPRAIRLKCQ